MIIDFNRSILKYYKNNKIMTKPKTIEFHKDKTFHAAFIVWQNSPGKWELVEPEVFANDDE